MCRLPPPTGERQTDRNAGPERARTVFTLPELAKAPGQEHRLLWPWGPGPDHRLLCRTERHKPERRHKPGGCRSNLQAGSNSVGDVRRIRRRSDDACDDDGDHGTNHSSPDQRNRRNGHRNDGDDGDDHHRNRRSRHHGGRTGRPKPCSHRPRGRYQLARRKSRLPTQQSDSSSDPPKFLQVPVSKTRYDAPLLKLGKTSRPACRPLSSPLTLL